MMFDSIPTNQYNLFFIPFFSTKSRAIFKRSILKSVIRSSSLLFNMSSSFCPFEPTGFLAGIYPTFVCASSLPHYAPQVQTISFCLNEDLPQHSEGRKKRIKKDVIICSNLAIERIMARLFRLRWFNLTRAAYVCRRKLMFLARPFKAEKFETGSKKL